MPATQKDIARLAGVSQTVVSDVLRGRPRGRVRPETRHRILEAARALGYRPNDSAQALRSRHSRRALLITTETEAAAFDALGGSIVSGVARGLAERDWRLLVAVAASHEEMLRELEALAAAGACDGALVRVMEEADGVWDLLARAPLPLVVIGQCPEPTPPSVAHDVPGMVRAGLEHLAALGHRSVAFLAGRCRGDYQRKLRAAWRATAPEFGIDPERWFWESEDRLAARTAAARWVREGPTAFFCVSDRVGLGVSEAIARAGRTIGDGIDLVVAGSIAHRWLYEPGTWHFGTDLAAIGRRAAEELLRLVGGGPSPGPVRILPELVRVNDGNEAEIAGSPRGMDPPSRPVREETAP